jgi:hypothetical protein
MVDFKNSRGDNIHTHTRANKHILLLLLLLLKICHFPLFLLGFLPILTSTASLELQRIQRRYQGAIGPKLQNSMARFGAKN